MPERAGARRIECKSFYHCEVTFLGVSARTFAHQLGLTHTHTEKKLEKKLNYLYALVGYRSVCSLLSLSFSLSLPHSTALQRHANVRSECALKSMPRILIEKVCTKCEIFLHRFLRFPLRIIMA